MSEGLDVLYRGLGISKLQFLIKKRKTNFQLYFFLKFLVIETLDPDPDSMNLDPQLCLKASKSTSMNKNKTKIGYCIGRTPDLHWSFETHRVFKKLILLNH